MMKVMIENSKDKNDWNHKFIILNFIQNNRI